MLRVGGYFVVTTYIVPDKCHSLLGVIYEVEEETVCDQTSVSGRSVVVVGDLVR